jgi:hypothetical protein
MTTNDLLVSWAGTQLLRPRTVSRIGKVLRRLLVVATFVQ